MNCKCKYNESSPQLINVATFKMKSSPSHYTTTPKGTQFHKTTDTSVSA